jgi:hypothetical protein
MDKCCFRICVDGTPKIKEAAVIAIAKMDRKPLATIVLVNKEDTVSDEE